MTLQEFSNEFDVLYNNIMSNAAPGLNEYEKSVFLTLALDEFVISAYSGRLPSYGAYEETEELKKYLDALNTKAILTPNSNDGLTVGNKCFTLPSDMLFTVYERVEHNNISYKVLAVSHDEYEYTLANPFRGPKSNRALSVDKHNNEVEIVPPSGVTFNDVTKYIVRYMKNPTPIILTSLTSIGATIKGISVATNTNLHEATHPLILKIAVLKAAQAYKL